MDKSEDKIGILIVDDDQDTCEVLHDALERRGFEVEVARDGEGALTWARKRRFNTALLDIRLPTMSGIRLMHSLKEIDQDISVVMITAYPSLETTRKALRNGASDYLIKPIDMDELCAIIDKGVKVQGLTQKNRELLQTLDSKHKELRRRVDELFALAEINKSITSTLVLDEVLNLITERAVKLMGGKVCSLRLLDDEGKELFLRASYGHTNGYWQKKGKLKLEDSLSGLAARERRPVFIKNVRDDPRYKYPYLAEKEGLYSLLSVPLMKNGNAIGVLNIYTSSLHHFSDEEIKFFTLFADQATIAIENARLYEELQEHYMGTIVALAAAIDAKDHRTQDHAERVTRYALAIAGELKLPEKQIRIIERACRLHDIGKIAISDEILKKPGKLTDEEWVQIKLHPSKGANMLISLGFLKGIVPLVRHHHERYDGRGYPDGLKGEDIILGARIIMAADAFEAMVSERPYRRALSTEEALKEIRENSGTQFDPKIAETLIRLAEEGKIETQR